MSGETRERVEEALRYLWAFAQRHQDAEADMAVDRLRDALLAPERGAEPDATDRLERLVEKVRAAHKNEGRNREERLYNDGIDDGLDALTQAWEEDDD